MMLLSSRRFLGLLCAALLTLGAATATAQQNRNWDAGRVYVTRQDLIDMLERLETVANSPAYSGRVREQSRREAEMVQNRLENGDFSTGDRIWMQVEAESALTDTFTVRDGPTVSLPDLGDVSLQGVLRSELRDHLTEHISRFIRNPVVIARPLIPVTVVGGVVTPGFYTVPTDGRFTDILSFAGGPAPTAKINEITVERGGKVLYDKEFIQQAIVEGRTVDYLSLKAGDQIMVPATAPAGGGGKLLTVISLITAVLAIPVAIVTIKRF